ncbi:conserved hypothetical protein [Xenorhabdus nematophila F1]|nr:conserved hypothetical protein [Xenorhabdus nematophila F1]CEF28480.1 hypothetical protein XNW1_1100004 [Xenorhabdus nematophila str. Websteri]CEF31013.1 hypothetical protein XNW1_3040003 [Xenorhabdus nematophila str. Websteri]
MLAPFFTDLFFLDTFWLFVFLMTFFIGELALFFADLAFCSTAVVGIGAASAEVDTAGAASAVLENNTSNAATDNFKFFIVYILWLEYVKLKSTLVVWSIVLNDMFANFT